jgi:hypothetical protein
MSLQQHIYGEKPIKTRRKPKITKAPIVFCVLGRMTHFCKVMQRLAFLYKTDRPGRKLRMLVQKPTCRKKPENTIIIPAKIQFQFDTFKRILEASSKQAKSKLEASCKQAKGKLKAS